MTWKNSKYCQVNASNNYIKCNTDNNGGWEKFKFTQVQTNFYSSLDKLLLILEEDNKLNINQLINI